MPQSVMILLAISTIASLLYGLRWVRLEPSHHRTLIKFVPVSCLSPIAWIMSAPTALAIGLAFGALGDIFLSRDPESGFIPGLASFLVGHVCFVVLFYQAGDINSFGVGVSWQTFAAVFLVLLALSMSWILRPHLGELLPAVFAYVLVILAMGLTALGLDSASYGLAILGAVMFIFSDAILATELFLMSEGNRLRTVSSPLLWFLYWGGQLLILLAFVLPA